MRIVFVGTPEFATPTLEALLERSRTGLDWQVVGVITQPDRPRGRGHKPSPTPVKSLAMTWNLPVLQPARLRGNPEAVRFLEETAPNLLVVAAFGQLLPKEIFDWPELGTLNVHASLLPRYRGAAPVARAIQDGETETGVTIMKIDAGMDTGDILTQSRVPIGEEMTTGELEGILAREGARLLVETLPAYAAGTLHPRPQEHDQPTLAPRLTREEGRIDWNRCGREIHNQIRALNPWPGCRAVLRGKEVKLWRSRIGPEQARPGVSPGEILAVETEGVQVACGRTPFLILTELQLPGRNRQPGEAFANGLRLAAGDRFE